MTGIKTKLYNLLRKSEKYTKTDMVYLVKGGFWLTLGQVVSSLAAFLLAIAFANLLPKETYGTYKYILSLFGLLAIPTLSGMGIAVTRAVAQGYDGSFMPALKLKIKWGLLGGLASLGLAGYYYLNNNIELTLAFLITTIFIPFLDSFTLYSAFLQGKKRFDIATQYGAWIKIIATISISITLYFTKNLLAILFIYLASYSLLRLIALKFSLKFIKNDKRNYETISYGKHLSLAKILNTVTGNIIAIFIFHLLGAGQLAIYSIAIAPLAQIRNVINFLKSLLLPKIAAKNWELNFKKILKKMFISSSLIIMSIIIYIIIVPFFYKIFFPNYLESIFYSQLLSLNLFLTFFYIISFSIIKAKKNIKAIYAVNLLNSLLNLLLVLPSIYLYQLNGLIYALIISRLIETLTTLLIIYKMSKIKTKAIE